MMVVQTAAVQIAVIPATAPEDSGSDGGDGEDVGWTDEVL